LVFSIVQATLNEEPEDDYFIPFDPPFVSKYGPISRNQRVKGRNTAPVNVTAEEVGVHIGIQAHLSGPLLC
jgi:hypothetical protein